MLKLIILRTKNIYVISYVGNRINSYHVIIRSKSVNIFKVLDVDYQTEL